MTDHEELRTDSELSSGPVLPPALIPPPGPEVSATQAVNQFGADIKEAIADIAKSIPQSPPPPEPKVTRRAVLWYAFTWFTTILCAAGISWLVAVYIPSHSSVVFLIRYGDTTASCSRGPSMPDGRPVLICVPAE